jgi:hypothetical protein
MSEYEYTDKGRRSHKVVPVKGSTFMNTQLVERSIPLGDNPIIPKVS